MPFRGDLTSPRTARTPVHGRAGWLRTRDGYLDNPYRRRVRPFMIASMRSACAGLCLAGAFAFSTGAASAEAIRFDPSSKSFELKAGAVSYVFGINERGELQ